MEVIYLYYCTLGTVKDVDGKLLNTITIWQSGYWMKENLKKLSTVR